MGRKPKQSRIKPEPSDEAKKLVGWTCRLGSPLAAIELVKLQKTLDGLPAQRQNFLMGCYVSLNELRDGDASMEVNILMRAIRELRDAWKKEPTDDQ